MHLHTFTAVDSTLKRIPTDFEVTTDFDFSGVIIHQNNFTINFDDIQIRFYICTPKKPMSGTVQMVRAQDSYPPRRTRVQSSKIEIRIYKKLYKMARLLRWLERRIHIRHGGHGFKV